MKSGNYNKKKPFEIRVMAVKGNPFTADTGSKRTAPDETYRLPCDLRAAVAAGIPEGAPDGLMRTARKLAAKTGDQQSGLQKSVETLWLRMVRILEGPARKALLISSGQVGMAVASTVTLFVTLRLFDYQEPWAIKAIAALLIIRLAYYLSRGPVPVLARHRIRKRLGWVISDETQISVGFLAACFLASWPVSLWAVLTFVGINMTVQIAIMGYSKIILRFLRERIYETDAATFARRAVIFGTGIHAQRVADMVLDSPDLDTKIIGFLDYHKEGLWRYRDIPLLGHPTTLESIVSHNQVDAVFVAVEPNDIPRSRALFDTAERMGVCVFVMPNVYYPTVSKIRPTFVNGMPALVYRSVPENQPALFVKSAIDKVGALIGLLFAAPVMLIAAIAIKLDSRGSVFFRQERTGVNGRPFKLYKFRTMCVDAEQKKQELLDHNEMTGPAFKMTRDPRITRVGRILRKFSIDELPQFFNVIKGDMSLVGPRPPLPSEVSSYLPWQHRKLSVKPGVTCLWQVNGRHTVGFDDWMQLDLEYIDNWSLWLDTKIILRTIPEVIKGSGV